MFSYDRGIIGIMVVIVAGIIVNRSGAAYEYRGHDKCGK